MRWECRRQKTDDNAPGIDGKVRIGKTTIEYDGKVRIEVTDVVAEFLEDDRKRQQAQDRSDRRYLSKGNFERDCVESQRTPAFRDDTFLKVVHKMDVDTVGRNKKVIEKYIQNQLEEDFANDQISLREYVDPFTGNKNKYAKGKQPHESGCLR